MTFISRISSQTWPVVTQRATDKLFFMFFYKGNFYHFSFMSFFVFLFLDLIIFKLYLTTLHIFITHFFVILLHFSNVIIVCNFFKVLTHYLYPFWRGSLYLGRKVALPN